MEVGTQLAWNPSSRPGIHRFLSLYHGISNSSISLFVFVISYGCSNSFSVSLNPDNPSSDIYLWKALSPSFLIHLLKFSSPSSFQLEFSSHFSLFTEFIVQILDCLCCFSQLYTCVFLVFNQEFLLCLFQFIQVFILALLKLPQLMDPLFHCSLKLCA